MQKELTYLRACYDAVRPALAPTTAEILALRRLRNTQPKAFTEVDMTPSN